jgi:hypothetical protein
MEQGNGQVYHSPPSSAEVENEYELYLLSPQAPPWRVAGLLYLFTVNWDSLEDNLSSDAEGLVSSDNWTQVL